MTESERDTFEPDVRALIEDERIIEPLEPEHVVRLEERLVSAFSAGSVSGSTSRVPRMNPSFATGLVIGTALGVLATIVVQSLWKQPDTLHPRVELTPSRLEHEIEPREVSAPEVDGSDAVMGAVIDEHIDVPSVEPRASIRPSSRSASRRGLVAEDEVDALARERRLLDAARGAIRGGNAEEALATLSRHARDFENGALTEEREALTIRAFIELGRIGEARMQAAGFRAAYPNSLLWSSLSQRLEAADSR